MPSRATTLCPAATTMIGCRVRPATTFFTATGSARSPLPDRQARVCRGMARLAGKDWQRRRDAPGRSTAVRCATERELVRVERLPRASVWEKTITRQANEEDGFAVLNHPTPYQRVG